MKKFGIIFCGYNTEEYVLESIEPFLKRDNHIVSAVSVPFKEYKGIDLLHDHTTDLLRELVEQKRLKYLVKIEHKKVRRARIPYPLQLKSLHFQINLPRN